jgi:hypothetical protein
MQKIGEGTYSPRCEKYCQCEFITTHPGQTCTGPLGLKAPTKPQNPPVESGTWQTSQGIRGIGAVCLRNKRERIDSTVSEETLINPARSTPPRLLPPDSDSFATNAL